MEKEDLLLLSLSTTSSSLTEPLLPLQQQQNDDDDEHIDRIKITHTESQITDSNEDLSSPPMCPLSSATTHELSRNISKDITFSIDRNCCKGCYCCRCPCYSHQSEEEDVTRLRFSINHNVALTLILAVTYGVSDSLWGGTVQAAYLKHLGGNKNGPVGNIEAVNGIASLLSALPVGYLADRYGRSRVIKIGGFLFVLAAILHVCLILWIGVAEKASQLHMTKSNLAMTFWAILMGLWGVGGGIVNGPCQALFADSIPTGSRSQYYHYNFVCYLVASCVGPAMSILLFETRGNDWDMQTLQIIMFFGLGLELFNAITMMFFDDAKALNEEDTVNFPQSNTLDSSCPADNDSSDLETPLLLTNDDNQPENSLVSNQDNPSPSDNRGNEDELHLKARQRWIPYILLTSGIIMSIGSGMTVKFFPLFFKDQIGMSPTQVQIIYVIVPIVMSIFSKVSTYVASKFLGRVITCILLQLSGVTCLLVMVIFSTYLDEHKWILIPIYVLRTALMNSPYPLQESILMDYVPKNERARWKSLESISDVGWCGSAALGGYLSDRWNYSVTFFVTACLQLAGTLIWSLLLPLVPIKEQPLQTSTELDSVSTNAHEIATPSPAAD
jgi:MFS family permease